MAKRKSTKKSAKKQAAPRPRRTRRARSILPAARTVVYVHGIGNKPEADILKCQWDTALFGFDLGERSRLAYWVNRAYYPDPSPGTCATGDLGDEDQTSGASFRGPRALGGPAELADDVAAEFEGASSSERKTMLAIARRMEASADSVRGPRDAGYGTKVIPLPAPVRSWITRRLTRAALRDVHDLFYVAERRRMMIDRTLDRLRAGGGPFVMIGHSQGSMIAYLALLEAAASLPGLEVPLFVTIGSPLGIQEVQDELKKLAGRKKLAVPGCVRRWLNVADPLDIVAADKGLRNEFTATNGVRVEDDLEWNTESPQHPHSGSGYLRTEPVRTAVRKTVDTAAFQQVAPFVLARDLTKDLERSLPEARHKVLIELRDGASKGGISLDEARKKLISRVLEVSGQKEDSSELMLESLQRFVAARLTRGEAEQLGVSIAESSDGAGAHRVWRNATKRAVLDESVHAVQAFPAHGSYGALGKDVAWAILDSGIAEDHPHFETHATIKSRHDCTLRGEPKEGEAPDPHGHGTHVAGIVAGAWTGPDGATLTGIAPRAGLHVYRVLDRDGYGDDSWIIKALDHIAGTNEDAGGLVIHGVNLSLGGGFDQSSYACGHSPLCRELRRLWRQGVLVVVAAGNEGFAVLESSGGPIDANIDLSIGDPANLEEAIAVGSTHKTQPHSYGISYFSSRGPTADGRQKPDCIAPGERILSCRQSFPARKRDQSRDSLYVEMSGTSMAAPHVSGVLASFLSMRREFIGQPDRVKQILLSSCTDIGRDRPMQGAGLPNLMRMLGTT